MGQVRPNIAKVDEAVDRSQHMVGRHMLLERELIKQSTLIDLPLTQHHLHSRCDNWSKSAKQPHRNLRLFQQNRTSPDVFFQAFDRWIVEYNNSYLHSALGYRSPEAFEAEHLGHVTPLAAAC